MIEANEGNHEGGSGDNTPSTPAPEPETHVDNSGDSGGGGDSAPIDTPSESAPEDILGTEGYIELRKYVNVASHDGTHDHVYVVDSRGERHFDVSGRVGYPFFRDVILDCLNRTERAMTQAHALKAAELCVKAQLAANAPFGD